MKDLMVLIFFYFVQAILMAAAGTLFFDLRVKTSRLLIIAGSYGLAILFIRKLYLYFQIPLGTHTLILMTLFCLLLVIIGKINFPYAVGITLYCTALIMLGGGLASLVLAFFSLDFATALNNVWLCILFGNLSENIFLIVSLVVSRLFHLNINALWFRQS